MPLVIFLSLLLARVSFPVSVELKCDCPAVRAIILPVLESLNLLATALFVLIFIIVNYSYYFIYKLTSSEFYNCAETLRAFENVLDFHNFLLSCFSISLSNL